MSRVLFGTNYPMRVAEQLVAEERYPSQHLWGVPGLRARGIDVHVVADAAGPAAQRMTGWSRLRLGDIGKQREVLRVWRPGDIAYAADPVSFAGLGLLRAARLWPGPVVAVVHPGIPRGRLWSRALRAYDVVLTLSQAVRERLITELGRDRETTLHAPWGPDLTFGPYAEPSSHEAVVATGKTARDTRTLLAALGELDAPAIVHSRAALDDAPPQVEVRAHAGVTPYLDALADLRRAAVVAIPFTAQDKLVGLSELNDALALGKPVVMTRSPHCDVDLERIGCGAFVEPGDVSGWVAALRRFLPLADGSGERGRRFAEDHWSSTTFDAQLERALELSTPRGRAAR
ncbi:MAG: hypothetical protein EPN99_06425 [Frankiales bacterium]|nr:MAG: hypothetical protein EPN99_06425 [Frankiales bacterium]